MVKEKKPVHRVQMTEGKRNIVLKLLEKYDIQTAENIQNLNAPMMAITGMVTIVNRQIVDTALCKSRLYRNTNQLPCCRWSKNTKRYL